MRFRGHPLHLILLSFPVAFWTGALVTDAAGAFSRDQFWFRMSVTLVAMGTAGAVLASIAGYADYRAIPMSPKARSVATGHLYWSLGTLAVFAFAWVARARAYDSPFGIGATLLGAAGLLVGAYLGSELSNRYGVGTSASGDEVRAAERRR